jgi:alpha-tubulin suppressor-like RCC1 family protein
VLAIKSDGTLWAWVNKLNGYDFYSQPSHVSDVSSNAFPMQVGTDNNWQSISSSSGNNYVLLKKKDGSFWAFNSHELRAVKPASENKPPEFLKLDLPKNIVAFAAGGYNIGVVLMREGEVWTWGNVMGEHAPKDFEGPNHTHIQPKDKVIDKPWQLSIVDPADSTAK